MSSGRQIVCSGRPRLLPIPRLGSAKDWPHFISIVESYLAESQFSPAGDSSLVETADNAAASRNLVMALVGKLHGEAGALFWNTGELYCKQGFAKLARLKEAYANESELALAMEVFKFFTELS